MVPKMRFFQLIVFVFHLLPILGYDAPADIPKFFVPEENANPNQMIPPNKPERFLTDADTYIYANALFIKPRLVGLAFAVEAVDPVYDLSAANPEMNDPIKKVYYPHFKHSLGYEVGAGFFLESDGLEVRFNFMALQEDVHSSTVNFCDEYGFGTWDPLPLASSFSEYELHFYRANFDIVYSFFVNQYISFDTYFGVIASWQNHYYNINYTYAASGWPITDNVGNSQGYPWTYSKISNKCNYSGTGARAGLSGQFYLTPHFSIRNNVALNLPWATYGVDTREVRYDANDIANIRYSFNQCIKAISPVLDLSVAFGADRWFRQRSCNVAVLAGYKEQIWFAQNRFQTPSNLFNGKGALFLQGAFIQFQLTL